MRASYRHRIGPGDVGSRVTVRRWVDDDDRGRIPSDVVGHLASWSEAGILTIRDRRERLVEVDERDILASRVIPPRHARG